MSSFLEYRDHPSVLALEAMYRDTPPVEFDTRGHQSWVDHLSVYDITTYMRYADKANLYDAWQTSKPFEPIELRLEHVRQCKNCGEGRVFDFDGFKATAKEPCPKADGIALKARLEVFSGQMLIGNDFRKWFPVDESDVPSINYNYGIEKLIRKYEQAGMLHFFVGNSSPHVYQGEEIMIGQAEDWDEEIPNERLGKDRGSVCTDLWWVSICDHETALANGYKEAEYHTDIVLDVEPGIYEIDYHALKKSFREYDGDTIYANLKLVG